MITSPTVTDRHSGIEAKIIYLMFYTKKLQ